MLYDNVLLALVYTEAYQETQRAYCREVICRTLDYVLTELTDPLGGFYCGQDADSDGVEGKYYVFTPEELRGVFGQEAADTAGNALAHGRAGMHRRKASGRAPHFPAGEAANRPFGSDENR